MKRTIRLTESDLHRVIKESVKTYLNEISFEKAQAAYQASMDPNRQPSPAMQRRMAKDSWSRAYQMNNLKQGATNAFNWDYGHNLKNVPYGSGDDKNMDIADPSKPAYAGRNIYAPRGNYFASGAFIPGHADTCDDNQNNRTVRNWGDDPNEYEKRDMEIPTKTKLTNPKFASAVRRGEKALDNSVRKVEPHDWMK